MITKDDDYRLVELIKRLRHRFDLTEDIFTDKEVLGNTAGSFGRALIELDMASDDLRGILKQEIRVTRDRTNYQIEKFLKMFQGERK